MDEQQVAASIKALSERQTRILTGTVVGTSTNPQEIPVRLDSDQVNSGASSVVSIPSICGIIPVDTRVSVITVPPAGMVIIGIVDAPYNLIGLWEYFVSLTSNLFWVIRRIYTVDDTWNKPTDPLFMGVVVQIQSGGGGSGGTAACNAQTSTSAGGQGGGYVKGFTVSALLGATAAVVVGAGGAGAAAGNNPGGTGGTSSFTSGASVLSIPGGAGGSGGGAGSVTPGNASFAQTTQAGGNGTQTATATQFDILDIRQGDEGGTGWRTKSGDDGLIVPGVGGGSRMGAQTRVSSLVTDDGPPINNKQITPIVGSLFGGGASGRGVNDYSGGGTVAAGTGAAGGQGIVIVEEIYRT